MAALSVTATDTTTSQLFDRLHWTMAYVTAAVLAWLGVSQVEGPDRTARRWFAIGLTITAIAILDYVYWAFTRGTLATREIRSREPAARRIPIVALTANAMKDDDLKCKAAGMDDHLSKPLDRERLAQRLAVHLS
jgi:CheY-like chemotaxis protein